MNILLSSSYDRSLPALLLAQGLAARGHRVCSILVVRQARVGNALRMVSEKGLGGLKRSATKYFKGRESESTDSPLTQLAEELRLTHRSLRAWAREHDCAWTSVSSLNSPEAVELAKSSGADVMVYAGGGILRRELIDALDGWVVNPHCGPLPEVRGVNAIEWAVLLEQPPHVTVHLIDAGVDTGRQLRQLPLPERDYASIEELRETAVAAGVRGVIDTLGAVTARESLAPRPPHAGPVSRQCFSLAPALQELLAARLQRHPHLP